MLTLDPASACEVCSESFGPGHVPAVIPCGHVFCAQCLSTIVDKTSPRLTPACPLCRGTFSDKTWRLIRVDLGGLCSGSGWSGADPDRDYANDDPIVARGKRADAKRLEGKVAQAASKKCSFEEVSALHKEVQDWLSHDPHDTKSDPQHASLKLSADLLRAILLNCLAYSESTKIAKNKEANLQSEIDKLNAELRRQRDLVAVKTQEAERLRDELNKLRPNNASTISSSSSTPFSTPISRPVTPTRTRSMPPSTPPRPGTSMGFSSASSSASKSVRSPPPPVPPLPSGISSTSSSSTTLSPMITSPARTPPSSQPSLPPAPVIPHARLPPSTPAPRSSTPAPSMFHRRTASAMAIPHIPRPSTSMGSRTSSASNANANHERWIPSQNSSPPSNSRGMRYPGHGSGNATPQRAMSTSNRAPMPGFTVLQEAD